MARQSLTSQMIDGVVESKKLDLSRIVRDIPLKTCFKCYAGWPNAQKLCHFCGYQFYG